MNECFAKCRFEAKLILKRNLDTLVLMPPLHVRAEKLLIIFCPPCVQIKIALFKMA